MDIDELYRIVNENVDCEVVAMSLVVRDNNSGKLTNYIVNVYGDLDGFEIEM